MARLAARRDPTLAGWFRRGLIDPRPWFRVGCMRGLAGLPYDPEWLPDLAGAVAGGPGAYRAAAYEVLGLAGSAGARAVLTSRAEGRREPDVRARAALIDALDASGGGGVGAPASADVGALAGAGLTGERRVRSVGTGGGVAADGELDAVFDRGDWATLRRRVGAIRARVAGGDADRWVFAAMAAGCADRRAAALVAVVGQGEDWARARRDGLLAAPGPGAAAVLSRAFPSALGDELRARLRGWLLCGEAGRVRAALLGLGAAGEARDFYGVMALARAGDLRFAPPAWEAAGRLLRRLGGAIDLVRARFWESVREGCGAAEADTRRALGDAVGGAASVLGRGRVREIMGVLRKDPDAGVRGVGGRWGASGV